MAGDAARKPLTIAIDGPAAAGKGTLAKRISAHYGLPYLDTGLLYRAVGRLAADSGIDLDDADAVGRIALTLDTGQLDDGSLRGREAGERASRVAVHPQVRAALIDVQRRFASAPEGAVLDGRDIGTVELSAKGRDVSYETILAEVRERDTRDAGRVAAPLKPAADAHLLDTSEMDIESAFRAACGLIDRATS
jgi:CMP/dCMP kinase